MTLRSQLQILASDLLDIEPSDDDSELGQFLEYWNEGLCLVAKQRPDMFTRAVTYQLTPGAVQEIDCCETVGKVFGQSDKYGEVKHARIPVTSSELADRWASAPCPPQRGPYRIRSIERDALSKNQLIVNPPVPGGEPIYLLMNCVQSPKNYTMSDLNKEVSDVDCGSLAAVRQWVIFRYLFKDADDADVARRANTAVRMFFTLINIKFKAELLYELGIVPVGKNTQLLNVGTGQSVG